MEVVEMLLQHKAVLCESSGSLATALHCACFGGNVTIFESMMKHAEDEEWLQPHIVDLGALALMADTSLAFYRTALLQRRNRLTFGPRLRCSPILLVAERCHFDLLQICRLNFHNGHGWPGFWETIAGTVDPREPSGSSTSSAWSHCGFPPRPNDVAPLTQTLLMWGAASLNLPLIEHLLEAGEKTYAQDSVGRTALHYAALPLEHATFEHVDKCFQRLLQGNSISLQTAEILLKLTLSDEHPALDPRISYKWGSDVHSRCIAAIFDHMSSAHEKQVASCGAMESILSYSIWQPDSVEVLCKHAVILDGDVSQLPRARDSLTTALHRAFNHYVPTTIISILLNHGADPNDCSGSNYLPLVEAIHGHVTEASVSVMLEYGADPHKPDHTGGTYDDTPYKLAVRLGRQDLVELFARVSSEQTWTVRRANEATDSVSSRSAMAGADAANAKQVAKATPRTSQRSWFAGLSAIALPGLRKDTKPN
jgi:ankyrin repeat protein